METNHDNHEASTIEIRSGTLNQGYDYEKLIPAYFALELLRDKTVQNFTFLLNSRSYKKFDDLIVTVKKTDKTIEKFAIQLKHREENRNVVEANKECQGPRAKNFDIAQFRIAFNEQPQDIQTTHKFLLFTNTHFNGINKVYGYQTSSCERPFKTELFNVDGTYQFKKFRNESLFWKQFFFISDQKDITQVEKAIVDIFKTFESEEQVDSYINFFRQLHDNKYTSTSITRDQVVLNLVKLLAEGCTIAPTSTCKDSKIELIEKALKLFDLTVLSESCLNFLKKNWKGSVPEDLNHFTTKAQELKLLKKGEKLTDKVPYHVLSIFLEKPLFLHVSEKNKELIKFVVSLLPTLETKTVSLVLIGKIDFKRDFQNRKIFTKVSDLKSHPELYHEFCKTFKVSLQGREPKTIDHLQVADVITPDEIFQFLQGDLLVGQKLEQLPQVYIPRTLLKSDVGIEDLETISKRTTMVHCGGNSSDFRTNLKEINFNNKILFVTEYRNSSDYPALILTDNETIAKDQKSFHHLRLKKENRLEWMDKEVDPNTLTVFENTLNILTGASGSGKTTMMKKLALICPSTFWVVSVSLQQVVSCFKKDSIKQLLNTTKKSRTESNFCEHFLEQKKVVFFFDGLNELNRKSINDTMIVITEIVKEGFQVWVSCTEHWKEFVLKELKETSCYSVGTIIKKDQEDYIQGRLQNVELANKVIEQNLQKLPKDLRIPLILFIITDIFINNQQLGSLSLDKLYGSFFEEKLKLNLAKTGCNHLDKLTDVIKACRRYYLVGYQLLGLETCLEQELFAKLGVKADKTFREEVQKKDFLEFVQDNGTFIHSTFGEYFTSMWLSDNFLEVPLKEWSFIFRAEYKGIRRFFDSNLAESCPVHLAIIDHDLEGVKGFDSDSLKKKDRGGRTPLHLAASLKGPQKREILEYLLDAGLSPDEKDELFGWNSLEYADVSVSLFAVEEFLKRFFFSGVQLLTHHQNLPNLFHKCVCKGYTNLLKTVINEKGLTEKCLLHLALEQNQEEVAKLLIEKDVKLEETDSLQQTPLHKAAMFGHVAIVELLLVKKVNIEPLDDLERTPLQLAAKFDYLPVLELLLKNGANINSRDVDKKTALHKAAYMGNTKIVRFLCENGSDFNARTEKEKNALHRAAEMGRLATVECLVECQAGKDEVDRMKRTPLHYAAIEGHIKIVEYLLSQNVRLTKDYDDKTAKDLAEGRGHVEIVEILAKKEKSSARLMENGCDVKKKRKDGKTCLHLAVLKGCTESVELLVRKKKELVDEEDCLGKPALHYAIQRGFKNMVEVLVSAGAKKSWGSETAVEVAKKSGKKEIVKVLEKP